jgi:hypothetical protein
MHQRRRARRTTFCGIRTTRHTPDGCLAPDLGQLSGTSSKQVLARFGVSWHTERMSHINLTQGEQNAIRRVSAGFEIGPDMWRDLARKGLVERRQGKRVLTENGRAALALLR